MAQVGLASSGWIDTQLSSALPPESEPPQISTVLWPLYGAYWGSRTEVPSYGYVRPARALMTEPGILGRTLTVANVAGLRRRASL